MPKNRNKKTPSPASYIEESLDSIGVTQLLEELKNVPSVRDRDSSYNLEEVLAEFGSGKNSVLVDTRKITKQAADK